ncbi:MAG: NAD(P) transhydrogenase subunit alpha [Planctomycetes bacterium]|nr:NAD(P) transhydrogenase subunit alpha [Planctomycetota bacterium]
MAKVFVPRESEAGETRVAATPETVRGFVKAGFDVVVEHDAGASAGFTNAEFEEAGAKIGYELGEADLVLCIRPLEPEACGKLKPGAIVIGSLQPTVHTNSVQALANAKATSFGLELVPRITRAQKMDILSSQATAAGYQAVLMAAAHLPKFFPLLMTAAGTIKPARVFILGAGVAGLQAIATARRLGAVVEANDVRSAAAEQVESLGAKFVDTGTPPQAETTGGYAKETTHEYLMKQREILTKHVSDADVVITTALIPGRKAPVIVTADMVKAMHPGSVIVDLAVAAGGNVEGSVAGKIVDVGGVKIIGEPNLPSLVGTDASRMWARNVLDFVKPMFKEGGGLEPDWEDEVLLASVVTRDGQIVHEGAKQAQQSSKDASQ